jgi:hypothetical protein
MPFINPDKIGVGLAKMLTIGFLSLAIVIILLLAF